MKPTGDIRLIRNWVKWNSSTAMKKIISANIARYLEYFDSVKIGLTATPAPHTVEIFGKPVFTYSYREAVIDGWLVDHEPPHQIETKLKKKGITWKKGETVPVFDKATGQLTNLENIPDDLTLEIDSFNQGGDY